VRRTGTLSVVLALIISAYAFGGGSVDLSRAKIVVLKPGSKILSNATDMLGDEIEKRTRIRLDIVTDMPKQGKAAIVIGTAGDLPKPPAGVRIRQKADAYAIWVDNSEGVRVYLVGYDERGALYAAGRVLRLLDMGRDELRLDGGVKLATAPKYALRGHQLGYRPKVNTYDGWDIKFWEQYYRDMIVFGMNAIELIPPVSDDAKDSPHFPKPPLEMMAAMSQLADDYGLEVWIWYPALDKNYTNLETIKYSIEKRREVYSALPRIDAVFVPGGDPGRTAPKVLMPLLEKHKKVLNQFHPGAQMWVSPQGFGRPGDKKGWIDEFYRILQEDKPKWFDGVVFGPHIMESLKNLRAAVPEQYPIRRYPDITHTRGKRYHTSCQYPVPNWDRAFQLTMGREPICPEPVRYTKIFRALQGYSMGFITYSEGVNDDLNKVVWSCLGWDPDMDVEVIVKEYSRYFIGREFEESFTRGIFGLEANWSGPIQDNKSIEKTLEIFQKMEKNATPQNLLNWRFQQGLCRAYHDALIQKRFIYENDLEHKAFKILEKAQSPGSLAAMDQAESILDKAMEQNTGYELRARVFELAEALFQSIRMQLSVEKYQAISWVRGGYLDTIDNPVNQSVELKKKFKEIRKISSENKRLVEIKALVDSFGYHAAGACNKFHLLNPADAHVVDDISTGVEFYGGQAIQYGNLRGPQ